VALNKAFKTAGIAKYVVGPHSGPEMEQIAERAKATCQDVVVFVQIDKNGNSLQPEITALRSRGFVKGNCVEDPDGEVMTIVDVAENGHVTLSDGVNKIVKTCEEVLSVYKRSLEIPKEYVDPDHSGPQSCKEHIDVIFKSAVMLGLHAALETMEAISKSKMIKIPSSMHGVYAAQKIKAKVLRMVPGAYACKTLADKGNSPRFSVMVRVPTGSYTYVLVMPSKQQAVVPAWFVRHADTADEANMEVQSVRHVVSAGVKSRQILVDVPYLINKKELLPGQELLLPPIPAASSSPSSHKRKAASIVLFDDKDHSSKHPPKRT
jgi:hypothetical protein